MKILITDPCNVNFGDDLGGQHVDAAEVVDVPKETAHALVRANRALYTVKTDDPSKGGINTAAPEELKAAANAVKARSAKAAAEETPAP